MEGLVLKRLAALAGRVSDGITGCGEIVENINADGVYTREQQIKVAKLKVAVEKLVAEIQNVVHFAQNESPELDEKISEYTALQEQAEDLIVEIELGLAPPKEVGQSNNGSNGNTTSKLPKLELPHFEGDILKWSQFWDLFKSNIDSRSDLKEVDKLSYLLGCLEGDAKKTVSGLLMTNKNYSIALQQLNDRYGKPDKIIEAHYKAINKIKPAVNEVMDCRRAFLEIEQHLRILESMNENVNQNNLLRMTVMEKYPQEVKYELQKAIDTDGYSMEVIRKSLKNIISAKENSMNLDEDLESQTESKAQKEHFTTETLFSDSRPSTSNTPANQNNKTGGKRNWKKRQNNKSKQNNKSTQLLANQKQSGPPEKRSKLECIFCHNNHYNDECKKFSTVDERKAQLKGRCFLCFRKQHVAENCTFGVKRCFHCKAVGKHNGSLCPTKFGNSTKNDSSSSFASHSKHDTILQTAMAKMVIHQQKKAIEARVLFDTGSQKSYITSSLAAKLKLVPMEESNLTVYTFGSMKPKHMKTTLVTLKVQVGHAAELEILAYVVPRITGTLPANFEIKNRVAKSHPKVNLAADAQQDSQAEVLIGSDYYYTFFTGGIQQIGDNLFLTKTVLGWIVSGQPDHLPPGDLLSFLTYVQGERERGLNRFTVPDPPLNDDNIKDLWELETIGIKDSPKILEQDDVIEFFNQTTKFEDGRYQVKWPWVEYPTDLHHNYGLALGRLTGLLKRLDSTTIKQYDAVLKDQLTKGVIEEVETAIPDSHPVHYLPHHCIVQEAKTTKLRIVYDASAKVNGKCSLNEYLYKGPQMLEELVSLLLRFRQHPIGVTSDIEKAFLQISLQKEDRDVTRFLWVRDLAKGVNKDNLVHYRFCRVPFGIISSPFLLAATIRFHLSQKHSPEAQRIADSLYVDNLITSCATEKGACAIYSEARTSFAELSMNIREWTSNSSTFMESVPLEQRSDKKTPSVLGLTWNTDRDSLSLSLKPSVLSAMVTTKREALRIIASIFDPCGFVAPLTLPARLMFQELWKQKHKWDDRLPQERLDEWGQCARLLRAAVNFTIPRAYASPSVHLHSPCIQEFHCFTDASKDAYSAVVYLRTSHGNEHSVSFVMSRSRLTPLRQKDKMTTPKLELLGVLIGTRLLTYVQRTIGQQNSELFLWTDNQAVLGWIKSERLLQPFVSRRVAEIKAACGVTFRYINSENNPADVATRILKSPELPDLWVHGPAFLASNRDCWPVRERPYSEDLPFELDNCDGAPVPQADSESSIQPPTVVALPASTCDDSPDDKAIIKQLQLQHYPREVAGQSTELTKSLRLFVDSEGILRCGGRLSNADLPFDQKFPILIPRGTPFTAAVIKRVHEQNYHVGVPHTLVLVRKRFWIPQGRGEVTKVVRKCPSCVKYGGGPFKLPEMPPLPKERVASCPPFTYTGLDYLGPLTIRQDGQTQKRWCCLFTCMAVRAIHLELVQDMSTEEFIHCLRRFAACKGVPVLIVSDNAAQFKLASEVVNAPFCERNNIQWRFIPELSPWQGGFYERLVGLVKHCLYRTLNKILLTNTQLQTVLKEIEAILNTRPLTAVGPENEHILTPSDFLQHVGTIPLNDSENFQSGKATATRAGLIDSWKKSRCALDEFYKMFRDQYLTSLLERPTFSHKQPRVVVSRPPRVGELVQVKDDSHSRAHWKVGRISEIIPSRDDNTRTVRVTFPSGQTLTRSISHLYPLEMDDDPEDERPDQQAGGTQDGSAKRPNECEHSGSPAKLQKLDDQKAHPSAQCSKQETPSATTPAARTNQTLRPPRKAAEAARKKMKLWTEQLLVRAASMSVEQTE